MSHKKNPTGYLTRRAVFSASHVLHSIHLSAKENKKIFGKCNNKYGHGHNYELEVTVCGEIDPMTGVILNLTDLKRLIEDEVVYKLDHKFLNKEVSEFKKLNPTAENIAYVIWYWLVKKLPTGMLHEVKIKETENNVAIFRG